MKSRAALRSSSSPSSVPGLGERACASPSDSSDTPTPAGFTAMSISSAKDRSPGAENARRRSAAHHAQQHPRAFGSDDARRLQGPAEQPNRRKRCENTSHDQSSAKQRGVEREQVLTDEQSGHRMQAPLAFRRGIREVGISSDNVLCMGSLPGYAVIPQMDGCDRVGHKQRSK